MCIVKNGFIKIFFKKKNGFMMVSSGCTGLLSSSNKIMVAWTGGDGKKWKEGEDLRNIYE